MADNPIRPAHYTSLQPEPIEVIESWELGFCLGNAVKYIARAGRKGDRVEDLKKAAWYLQREIERSEENSRWRNSK
jgi:hypothetical protein